MAKRKMGLHKEISAIFDGVPLPNRKDGESPSTTATVDRSTGHIPPRPSVPPPKAPIPTAPPPLQPTPAVVQPKPSPELVSISKPFKRGLTDQLGPFWNSFKAKVFTPPEGVSQSKHMVTVTLIPILFIAVLFIFGRLLIKPSSGGGSPQTAGATTMAASIKNEVDWKVPAPYPTNLRDPMTRAPIGSAANAAVAGDMQVRGIVYSSDSPTAVIGTRIVSEGDTIFGAKVLNINKDSVEFEKDGEKWTQKVQY
jgi:hypothetical protein